MLRVSVALLCSLAAGSVWAETGYEAWLRYAPLDAAAARQYRETVPAAIVVGTLADIRKAAPRLALDGAIAPEGFWLKSAGVNGVRYLVVAGGDERGALYGAFTLLRKIATSESVQDLDETRAPSSSIRWLNLWDTPGAPPRAAGSGAAPPPFAGPPGPAKYKRTIADAGNTLARALKPHGGLLLYRAFVYDHYLDYNDLKADRARAAYDNFHPLDGLFDDNVVIQIKNGPIDFQVREPASPLFSGLEKTSQAIELQIFQEYNGKGRQLVNGVPWWKDNLDFDMRVGGRRTLVRDIVTGKVFNRPVGGFVGVTTTSMTNAWERSLFSQANLYGFGRLAWDPALTSMRIIEEWTRLTYGNDVRYFDYPQGVSRFRLLVGSQVIEEWSAGDRFPMRVLEPDGASSTRYTARGVALRPGDEIRIVGVPEAPETSALDYVELLPEWN